MAQKTVVISVRKIRRETDGVFISLEVFGEENGTPMSGQQAKLSLAGKVKDAQPTNNGGIATFNFKIKKVANVTVKVEINGETATRKIDIRKDFDASATPPAPATPTPSSNPTPSFDELAKKATDEIVNRINKTVDGLAPKAEKFLDELTLLVSKIPPPSVGTTEQREAERSEKRFARFAVAFEMTRTGGKPSVDTSSKKVKSEGEIASGPEKKQKKNWLKRHKFWTFFIILCVVATIISVLSEFNIIK